MGRVTTVSQTLQNAVAATGNGAVMDVAGLSSLALQVLGAFTATVSFEGSNDGVNWSAVPLINSASAYVSSANAPGLFETYFLGYLLFRARVTWTSGTSVTVLASGSGA